MKKIVAKFLCLVAGLFVSLYAQAVTNTYTCRFAVEATPERLSKPTKPFELRFIVDANTKKAYLMGNLGSSEVEMIPNMNGISFIEVTASGNVMVTTITESGEAVHSRNGIVFKELVPSQFYGNCVLQ